MRAMARVSAGGVYHDVSPSLRSFHESHNSRRDARRHACVLARVTVVAHDVAARHAAVLLKGAVAGVVSHACNDRRQCAVRYQRIATSAHTISTHGDVANRHEAVQLDVDIGGVRIHPLNDRRTCTGVEQSGAADVVLGEVAAGHEAGLLYGLIVAMLGQQLHERLRAGVGGHAQGRVHTFLSHTVLLYVVWPFLAALYVRFPNPNALSTGRTRTCWGKRGGMGAIPTKPRTTHTRILCRSATPPPHPLPLLFSIFPAVVQYGMDAAALCPSLGRAMWLMDR